MCVQVCACTSFCVCWQMCVCVLISVCVFLNCQMRKQCRILRSQNYLFTHCSVIVHLKISSFFSQTTPMVINLATMEGPRDHTQASQLAGTMFLHIYLKIRTSQKLHQIRAGIARKREETESIIHQKFGDPLRADHKVLQ